jgi:hypothetical protein
MRSPTPKTPKKRIDRRRCRHGLAVADRPPEARLELRGREVSRGDLPHAHVPLRDRAAVLELVKQDGPFRLHDVALHVDSCRDINQRPIAARPFQELAYLTDVSCLLSSIIYCTSRSPWPRLGFGSIREGAYPKRKPHRKILISEQIGRRVSRYFSSQRDQLLAGSHGFFRKKRRGLSIKARACDQWHILVRSSWLVPSGESGIDL